MWARTRQTGFTIVELLIVIVVIGILAAITIVAYNGIQTRAQNTQRINEIQNWKKIFEVYRAHYGQYPAMVDGQYCLGTGFLVGGGGVRRCRDYAGTGTTSIEESSNSALMTELSKVATLPRPSNLPANGTVGPYAEYSSSTITIFAWIKGGSNDCPAGTSYVWDDATGNRVACVVRLTR